MKDKCPLICIVWLPQFFPGPSVVSSFRFAADTFVFFSVLFDKIFEFCRALGIYTNLCFECFLSRQHGVVLARMSSKDFSLTV